MPHTKQKKEDPKPLTPAARAEHLRREEALKRSRNGGYASAKEMFVDVLSE